MVISPLATVPLFMVYLMTVSVTKTTQGQIVGLAVNNEVARMSKEMVVA